MSEALDNRRLVTRLLAVVVGMFAFGFALVPIYDVMCQAFGINGKTAGAYQGQQAVDESRQVRVQFLATNSADMVWEFHPKADELTVVAGALDDGAEIDEDEDAVPEVALPQELAQKVSPLRWCYKECQREQDFDVADGLE